MDTHISDGLPMIRNSTLSYLSALVPHLDRSLDLPQVHSVYRRELLVLSHNMGIGQVYVASYHLQCGVSENQLKGENIPAVHEVVDREGMPKQMNV